MKLKGELNLNNRTNNYTMVVDGKFNDITLLLNSRLEDDISVRICTYTINNINTKCILLFDEFGILTTKKNGQLYQFVIKDNAGAEHDLDNVLWNLVGRVIEIEIKTNKMSNTVMEGKY